MAHRKRQSTPEPDRLASSQSVDSDTESMSAAKRYLCRHHRMLAHDQELSCWYFCASNVAKQSSHSDRELLVANKSISVVDYHITLRCGRRDKIKNFASGVTMPDGMNIGHSRGLAFGRHSSELQDDHGGSEHRSWIHGQQTYPWHNFLGFSTHPSYLTSCPFILGLEFTTIRSSMTHPRTWTT